MKTDQKEKILKILKTGFGPYVSRFSLWYLIILIFCLSFYYNYQDILFLRPQGIHQWRQCYGLSFTMNYYQDNNPLLKPALHFLGRDATGKTAGEFPILYYLTAKLWKLFGYHEYIFRLVNLFIFIIGLIALMKIFEDVLQDTFFAITLSLLLFAAPVLVYYANNFIPNTPSLGLVLMAWYFFWLFYKKEKSLFLWLSMLAFALAGLIKVTAILSLIALSAIFFLEITGISKFRKGEKLFKHPLVQCIPFILAFSAIFSWYLYANIYNRRYNADLLAVGILPIWDLKPDEIHDHLRGIRDQFKWSYYHQSMYWILALAFASIIIRLKKANNFMLFLTLFVLTGIIFYVIFFFKMLFQHDYYVTDLYIFVPILFLTSFYILKNHYPTWFRSIILRLGLVILILINIGFTRDRINERYSIWMNDNYLNHIHRFENISPYLRSIGIGPDDKVLCLPDPSPIITLYFMNQKGWTDYSTNLDSTRISWKINSGADYLFIYIDSLYSHPDIKPFLKDKIGEINDIGIYDISSFRTNKQYEN